MSIRPGARHDRHAVMTPGEWQEVYRRAGDLYHSSAHDAG